MRFWIFISKEDEFYGSAKRIQDICKIDCKIIYIEDFINLNNYSEIKDSDIIYFLCNGDKVNFVINKIASINSECIIINKEYLLKNDSKSMIQQKLLKVGLLIPEILNVDNINSFKFPIFCKQNAHAGIVFKAYTKSTIVEFFKRFSVDDFYLEESLTNDLETNEEFKIYFVKDKAYLKDNLGVVDKDIVNICIKISKALNNLEVFSVDFIKNNQGLYIIDVNAASGFYLSTGARKELLKQYVSKEK